MSVPDPAGDEAQARAAAAAVMPEAAAAPPPPPQPQAPPPPPKPIEPEVVPKVDEVQILLKMCEMATLAVCRLEAARSGVRLTPADLEALKYSPDEQAQLRMFAPAALPYLSKLAKHADKVGAALFALTVYSSLSIRRAAIRARAEEMRGEKEKKPAPPGGPAPAVPTGAQVT